MDDVKGLIEWLEHRAHMDNNNLHREAATALTLAQARIRELEKRERTIERIVTELERQNKVNDGYASSLPKAERATSELWLICNSHTKDRTCELRQALKEASE